MTNERRLDGARQGAEAPALPAPERAADWFAGRVAETYDGDGETERHGAGAPVVDFLEPYAAGGALELGIGTGRDRAAARGARRARRGHRPLAGHGRAAPEETRRRRHSRRAGGLRHDVGRPAVLDRLPRLQHDHEPDVPGRAGRVLPERRGAPRTGRALRDRGRGSRPAAATHGEVYRPFTVRSDHLGFDEYDVPNQGLVSHHYSLDGGRVETIAMPFRYVWPAELDLMARLAGLRLAERFGG
jgi:hypothetical protein